MLELNKVAIVVQTYDNIYYIISFGFLNIWIGFHVHEEGVIILEK
jgi:hypothetical protein